MSRSRCRIQWSRIDRGAHSGDCALEFAFSFNEAFETDHVDEDTVGAQEDVVFADDAGIYNHFVLDLNVVAQNHAGFDEGVLADAATFANDNVFHQMAPVPDAGMFPNGHVLVDDGGGMDEAAVHVLQNSGRILSMISRHYTVISDAGQRGLRMHTFPGKGPGNGAAGGFFRDGKTRLPIALTQKIIYNLIQIPDQHRIRTKGGIAHERILLFRRRHGEGTGGDGTAHRRGQGLFRRTGRGEGLFPRRQLRAGE